MRVPGHVVRRALRVAVWLLVLLYAFGYVNKAHAQAPPTVPNGCAVNSSGYMVCVSEPNTGTVNNNPVTLNPHNCGYVNGVYNCYDGGGNVVPSSGTATNPGTPTPATDSQTPGSGGSQNCGWLDLGCELSAFSNWLQTSLLYVPRKVFEWFGAGVGNVISSIPVPGFLNDLRSALANLPTSVGWWVSLFDLKYGLSVILGAIIARRITKIMTLGMFP